MTTRFLSVDEVFTIESVAAIFEFSPSWHCQPAEKQNKWNARTIWPKPPHTECGRKKV